ncbi:MAG: efflux RND transporter periplasmic adaptor subunit [Polyangiaceae bacterium]|nr:efflux RND transporter periplasmic adaptor subunit [Polyangiaceae bacterium]
MSDTSASLGAGVAGGTKVGPPESAPRAPKALEKELSGLEGKKWLKRLGIVLAVAAVIALFVVWRAKTAPPPPAKYITGTTSRGDVFETVQSTGQVKPLTEVQVGAQVSGRVIKVLVDFNSPVKAGQVIAEIDPTLFSAQADSSAAQLAASRAQVARADANLAMAKVRLDRAKNLVAEGVGTQADVDAAQGAYDVALADVAAAKAQSTSIGAQARSSRTNLDLTKIYSPIDGIVINRAIDEGQTVAASFQAPVLFVIAQDLRKMRVLADIDEADVGRLKEGMAADVSVDAFPGEKFKGVVSQVRFSPTNVSGVVTYAAVVEVENPDMKLRPGMTATVTIRSAEARDVTRVPNSALRFKPSPPVDKDGKKIPQEPLAPLKPGQARVYILVDEKPGDEKIEPRVVEVGITDGIHTALKTDLGEVKIVTDETDEASKPKGTRGRMF